MNFKFERSILNNALYDLPDHDKYGNLTPRVIIESGNYTDADAVCEWSARLCYNSNDKFGTVPTFINGLMKSQHYDVIEHGVLEIQTLDFYPNEYYEELLYIKQNYPYMKLKFDEPNGRDLIISANLRVWRQFLQHKMSLPLGLQFLCGYDVASIFMYVAPNIFGEFFADHHKGKDAMEYVTTHCMMAGINHSVAIDQIETSTGAVVTLLAKLKSYASDELSHATLQIDHVSRAFTHQHVRHRLLSHSQASQRYIDASNADYIFPPNMTPDQLEVFGRSVDKSLGEYTRLRNLGLKKEDARAVLPNCIATRIVSSAYMDGWNHYIKLRDDKAAQFEIREVAQAMKEILRKANLS